MAWEKGEYRTWSSRSDGESRRSSGESDVWGTGMEERKKGGRGRGERWSVDGMVKGETRRVKGEVEVKAV